MNILCNVAFLVVIVYRLVFLWLSTAWSVVEVIAHSVFHWQDLSLSHLQSLTFEFLAFLQLYVSILHFSINLYLPSTSSIQSLTPTHLPIHPPHPQQLPMRPPLHHPPLPHHKNHIRILHRRQPMRNYNPRYPPPLLLKHLHDLLLGLGVEVRRRFVQ